MDPDGAVAIVGMACRFPGCETLDDFWRILVNGENHVQEITADRWNVEAFFDPNSEAPGKSHSKWAGLLDRAFDWDNVVFNVNEQEAVVMDPQQKIALEVSYKALENAGIPLQDIRGSTMAVYMCQMNADYATQIGTDIAGWKNYEFTGTSPAILANRISYTFDLRGPSVSLDTACSGSMVAVHLGINSINSGDCDMALCGGSNFIIGPGTFIALTKSRMASPTGQCRAFSADADGYVKAEGCGMVVLKRLGKALSDGDRIWGVIKTAIASDGHAESPITNPSKEQLRSLITRVCEKAKICPEIIQYVECHGTGTPAGDPAEAWGVGNTIGKEKQRKGLAQVPIGSVKSNLSHLEASAGTAGLLKVILMMKHGKLVPSLHCQRLSPNIDFKNLHVRVNTKVSDLGYVDDKKKMRVVSLNSNGFGGTSVHSVVQQEECLVEPPVPTLTANDCLPFLFTAATHKSLQMTIVDTVDALESDNIKSMHQLSHTSTTKRTHFPIRHLIFASTKAELLSQLKDVVKREKIGIKTIERVSTTVIFAFSGMGSQWKQMGQSLYEKDNLFKEKIEAIQKILDNYKPKVSISKCFKGEHDLLDPLYGQPTLFSIQVGLSEMLKAKGVNPDVVLGHSVGEVAAAFCSGTLSLEDAVKIIFFRGKILQKVSGGSMLAIGHLKTEKVRDLLLQCNIDLDIAAENSPTACTLSGSIEAIDQFHSEILRAYGEGVFIRKLNVQVAFHSKYMDAVSEELQKCLSSVKPGPCGNTKKRLVSSVTGEDIEPNQICCAEYWQRNLREGVLFQQAFSKVLSKQSHNIIVEIGPKPVLRSYIKELAANHRYTHITTMLENTGRDQVNEAICSCINLQGNVDWKQFYTNRSPVGEYPRYIFQRKYLYKEPENATLWRDGHVTQYGNYSAHSAITHPFVSKDKASPSNIKYVAKFTATTTPFVFEHKYGEMKLVPGGTYPEISLAAVAQFQSMQIRRGLSLEVTFLRPLVIRDDEEEKEAIITLFTGPDVGPNRFEFDVTTGEVLHASGSLTVNDAIDRNDTVDTFNVSSIQSRSTNKFDSKDLYDALSNMNFSYGKSLQWGSFGFKNKREILLRVEVPKHMALDGTTIHPVWIDSLFQMFALADPDKKEAQMIPQKLGILTLHQDQEYIKWAYIQIQSQTPSLIVLDGYLLGDDGSAVLTCKEMTVAQMGEDTVVCPMENMFHMRWKEEPNVLDDPLPQKERKRCFAVFLDSQKTLEKKLSTWTWCTMHKIPQTAKTVAEIEQGRLREYLPSESVQLDGLLYGWCLDECGNDKQQGQQIADRLSGICFQLLQVVKAVQSLSYPLPIFILVNGLFKLSKNAAMPSEMALKGCIASAITGMMRTLAWEVPMQDYRIVDIGDLSENTLLSKIIVKPPDASAEIAIVGDTVQLCHFMPHEEKVKCEARRLTMPYTSKVDLTRKQQDAKLRYLLEVHTEKTHDHAFKNPETKHLQEIALEIVLIDNTRSSTSPMSPDVTTYDSIGHNSSGEKFTIIFPVKVTTDKILVPSTNCLPMSFFPGSLPTLSFWIMAWSLVYKSEICRANMTWAVVGFCEQSPLCEAVKILAKVVSNASETQVNDARCIFMYVEDSVDTEQIDRFRNTFEDRMLYVLTKSQSICHKLKSNMQAWMRVHYILSEEELFSTALNFFMVPFRDWLETQKKTTVLQMIGTFEAKLKRVLHTTHLANIDGLNSSDYVLLDLQGKVSKVIDVHITDESLFKKDASYLIVGGSKGLGFELALHLGKQGAGRIAILSRGGIKEDQWNVLNDISAQYNCDFVELKADVTNFQQLKNVIQAFTSSSKLPLKGVFFGAVVLHDSTLVNMTRDIFQEVVNPKVAGAWNVFKLCKTCHLDYFVLHSSIVTMCGNVGQTNYAAANAFLDGLALYSRKTTGVGQSICWGALDLGLLEHRQKTKTALSSRGIKLMGEKDILACFNHAMLYNPSVVGYAKFNFVAVTKQMRKIPKPAQNMYRWVRNRKGHFVKDISKQLNLKTVGEVALYLRTLVHSITLIEEDEIDLQIPLEHLGVDSYQAITIYSNLVEVFGDIENLNVMDMPLRSLSEIADILNNSSNENIANLSAMKEVWKDGTSDDAPQHVDTVKVNQKDELKKYGQSSTQPMVHHNLKSNASDVETMVVPDISWDYMKTGENFDAGGVKLRILERNRRFFVQVKEKGRGSSKRDIMSVTSIDVGEPSGDSHLYSLCLAWSDTTPTTIHSSDKQLLKGWQQALLKLKSSAERRNDVITKSPTCVLL